MANPHRGEVTLTAGEDEYVVVFTTNALATLESATGKSVSALAGEMENPSVTLIRSILWAGLVKRQPEMTIAKAGDIIDEATMPVVVEVIGKAFALAFPEAKAGGRPDPRTPSRRTGGG